jgi:putative addiction module component (TIGR02574 family)
MNERAKALGKQARELSVADRIALVEDLLDSLHRADPDLDRLWTAEARDRLAAYRRGDLAATELSKIIAKYGL